MQETPHASEPVDALAPTLPGNDQPLQSPETVAETDPRVLRAPLSPRLEFSWIGDACERDACGGAFGFAGLAEIGGVATVF